MLSAPPFLTSHLSNSGNSYDPRSDRNVCTCAFCALMMLSIRFVRTQSYPSLPRSALGQEKSPFRNSDLAWFTACWWWGIIWWRKRATSS